MTFGKLVDKAKEKSKEATSSIKETTQNIAYISKEKMQAGVNKTIDETQALIVILQKCGYIVGDLAMTLSVPPEIELTLQDAGGGQSKLAELMEKEDSQKEDHQEKKNQPKYPYFLFRRFTARRW